MDRETVAKWFEFDYLPRVGAYRKDCKIGCDACMPKHDGDNYCDIDMLSKVLSMLKEQESMLGIQQTADGITFISTGTAQQGEARGMLLGKAFMHEWIYKELLHKGLLTDDIRSVFEQAKHI